jgi:4-azaleucine resistance transporter AzlC
MNSHPLPSDPSPDSLWAGARACLPTVLGYWSIGFAAGGIGALSGYSIQEVGLLAGLLYAGSAQFLFYGMGVSGAGALAVALAVLMVNIRYLLMSSSLSPYFRQQSTTQKFVGGLFLTDETFSVAAQHAKEKGQIPFRWLLGLNLTAYLNWLVANLAGATLANRLPKTLTDGLSFSLTAMFVGLLLLTYFSSKRRGLELMAISIASCTAALTFPFLDANISTLVATIFGATIALAWTRRQLPTIN